MFQISVMTKLVPSPDWFIGLDSLDLCSQGSFVDSVITEVSYSNRDESHHHCHSDYLTCKYSSVAGARVRCHGSCHNGTEIASMHLYCVWAGFLLTQYNMTHSYGSLFQDNPLPSPLTSPPGNGIFGTSPTLSLTLQR